MGCASSKADTRNDSGIDLDTESAKPQADVSKPLDQSTNILVGQSIFNSNSSSLSILLIFPKTDKQSKWLIDAAAKLNYSCSLILLNYSALELNDKMQAGQRANHWLEQLPVDKTFDLVLIDRRRGLSGTSGQTRSANNLLVPSDIICQTLSRQAQFRHSVIAALLPQRSLEKQSAVMNSTYNAGFNKCFFEFTSPEAVERELSAFYHNELLLIRKCRDLDSRTHNKEQETSQSENGDKLNVKGSAASSLHSNDKNSPNLHLAPLVNMKSILKDDSQSSLNQATEDSANSIIDSIAAFHEQDKKMRAYVSVRHQRGPSRSIPCSTSEAFDQHMILNLLNTRNQDAFLRFHNLNASSPLCKVIAILNSSKTRSSNLVAKELQKAIDIICKSDVFINQLFRPVNQHQDPLTADLIEGLMVNVEQEDGKKRFPRSASTGSALKTPVTQTLPVLGLTPEIEACLENDDRWDYDILALENVTQKRPLRFLAMKIFNRFNVFEVLRIEEPVMMAWLSVIEENYHQSNPYHNATHAADVMQSTAYLMRRDLLTSVFDSMDEVAMLLAAVVHDLNHPGRTNPFLVNSNNPLAILYNDLAVLESHHVALAFELTRKDPQINIFRNLTRDEYRIIRGYMIDMVLATEMARHFDHVSKFINNLSKPILQKTRLHDQSSVGSMSSVESGSVGTTSNSANFHLAPSASDEVMQTIEHLTSTENRAILKRMIIKCSDVNNPTRSLSLCKEWASRIAEEYFCQTEEEKRLGLPIVMPNFDRQTCNIPKSQISFIDFFLKDMFSAFDSVCSIPELIRNLESNYEYWEGLSKSEAQSTETEEQP